MISLVPFYHLLFSPKILDGELVPPAIITPAQFNLAKINRYKKILKNDASFKEGPILQLHFYSNHAGRLVLGGGSHSYWNTETYPLDSIKEFEAVSTAWKKLLAELLKKGCHFFVVFVCQFTNIYFYFSIVFVS